MIFTKPLVNRIEDLERENKEMRSSISEILKSLYDLEKRYSDIHHTVLDLSKSTASLEARTSDFINQTKEEISILRELIERNQNG